MQKYKIIGKCPVCLTGKRTYELDKREPMCPYIHCYKDKKCCFFVDMNEKKGGILSRIIKRVSVTPPEKIAL